MLRNLALNPHIRTLAIWGNGPLSNTPFGRSGTDVIRALWNDGLEEGSVVAGTGFELEPEIDVEVIEKIRQNVELLDLSEFDVRTAADKLPDEQGEAYMEATEFDPPAPRPISTYPSERVGFTVHGHTVLDAWQHAIFHVMRYGVVKGTQYGMEQRELPALQWVVRNEQGLFPGDVPEDWPHELRETVGVTEEAIKQYHNVFLSGETKEGVAYTYGSRLRSWNVDGIEKPINQVKDAIIGNLANSPDSRRGVATTLVPQIDAYAKEPPCLISVQVLQSEGDLHLFATFRSHDMFKAAIPNAFGLLAMQDEIAQETGFKRGHLCIQSVSAHIYEGDFDHAEKLMNCSFLEREPDKVWNADNADKRGAVVIRIEEGEIVAEHQSPSGQLIQEYRGKTAKDISLKLSQLALVSQISHAMDIGHELQKAEHAIRLGIPYAQDPPLDFSKINA